MKKLITLRGWLVFIILFILYTLLVMIIELVKLPFLYVKNVLNNDLFYFLGISP